MFMLHLLMTLCVRHNSCSCLLITHVFITSPPPHNPALPASLFCTYANRQRARPPPFDVDCLQIKIMID